MRSLFIFLFIAFSVTTTFAQRDFGDSARWTLRDRGYLGLGLGGLGFGNSAYGNYFSAGVSGLAGCMLTKNLSTGVGLEYQYTSYSDANLRTHQYVTYPFVRYNIKDFFIQFDYDFYSINVNLNTQPQRRVYERFFMGLGYSPNSGGRARVNFLVSYDLFYPGVNVFNSPLNTRFYFTF